MIWANVSNGGFVYMCKHAVFPGSLRQTYPRTLYRQAQGRGMWQSKAATSTYIINYKRSTNRSGCDGRGVCNRGGRERLQCSTTLITSYLVTIYYGLKIPTSDLAPHTTHRGTVCVWPEVVSDYLYWTTSQINPQANLSFSFTRFPKLGSKNLVGNQIRGDVRNLSNCPQQQDSVISAVLA